MKRLVLVGCAMAACLPLSGCMVMGYSSRGGFFFWPGGLGLLVIIAVVYLLLRRR
ncbi:hypothetical protein GCM10022270_13560 [Terriglobus aquaticus]